MLSWFFWLLFIIPHSNLRPIKRAVSPGAISAVCWWWSRQGIPLLPNHAIGIEGIAVASLLFCLYAILTRICSSRELLSVPGPEMKTSTLASKVRAFRAELVLTMLPFCKIASISNYDWRSIKNRYGNILSLVRYTDVFHKFGEFILKQSKLTKYRIISIIGLLFFSRWECTLIARTTFFHRNFYYEICNYFMSRKNSERTIKINANNASD